MRDNQFGASNKSVRLFPDNQMTHLTIILDGARRFCGKNLISFRLHGLSLWIPHLAMISKISRKC